ncbi:hypothetical protein ACPJHQ_12510 [Rossellomorea sp. H39__3]
METHSLIYKVATEKEEMDQINRLNYRTFVEEIPSTPPMRRRRSWIVFMTRIHTLLPNGEAR